MINLNNLLLVVCIFLISFIIDCFGFEDEGLLNQAR
jgi:hypothetical protein